MLNCQAKCLPKHITPTFESEIINDDPMQHFHDKARWDGQPKLFLRIFNFDYKTALRVNIDLDTETAK